MNVNQKQPNHKYFEIKELYAFIAKDKDGEGVMGLTTPDGPIPMIGADVDRVNSLKPFADKISKQTGTPYEIRYFVVKK